MRRALPLHLMAPRASLEETALSGTPPPRDEVTRRIKGVMEPVKDAEVNAVDVMFLIPGHPPIRPNLGYIHLVSFGSSLLSISDGA